MNEQQQHSDEFLLTELKSFSDSFWKNEEAGEKRVNFFITLVTAVITALVAFATKGEGREEPLMTRGDYWITVFALLALLSFGVVTLLRMIRRNCVTDEYKKAMRMIRNHFRSRDEQLQNYQPFVSKPRKLGTGSLVEMVSVVNSIIVAALCVLSTISYGGQVMGMMGVIGFIAALITQFLYVDYRYKERPKT